MTGDGDVDTSRKTVKTFVPAYQKDEWKRHADDLDMSQSEFVRTMVQAGRRDFEIETQESAESTTPGNASGANGTAADVSADSDDGQFEERVLAVLSDSEHLSWDELVERLTDDVEDRLEEALQRLQTENRVQYSGRHGGYAVVEGDRGD